VKVRMWRNALRVFGCAIGAYLFSSPPQAADERARLGSIYLRRRARVRAAFVAAADQPAAPFVRAAFFAAPARAAGLRRLAANVA